MNFISYASSWLTRRAILKKMTPQFFLQPAGCEEWKKSCIYEAFLNHMKAPTPATLMLAESKLRQMQPQPLYAASLEQAEELLRYNVTPDEWKWVVRAFAGNWNSLLNLTGERPDLQKITLDEIKFRIGNDAAARSWTEQLQALLDARTYDDVIAWGSKYESKRRMEGQP